MVVWTEDPDVLLRGWDGQGEDRPRRSLASVLARLARRVRLLKSHGMSLLDHGEYAGLF